MEYDRGTPQEVGPPEGHYANYFRVGHNAFEFLLDFGQLDVERQAVQFHTRIITIPVYAKILFELFRESVDRYEQRFGMIPNEDETESNNA